MSSFCCGAPVSCRFSSANHSGNMEKGRNDERSKSSCNGMGAAITIPGVTIDKWDEVRKRAIG